MQKIFGLIGLAKKAGKLALGEDGVKDAVRFGKAQLVIIAEDASENTKKSIINSSKYYGVKYYITATKEDLGHAVGKGISASVAVLDDGFAKNIEKFFAKN